MHQTQHFALLVVAAAGAGLLAVLSNRVTELLRVPPAALFLAAAAAAARVLPALHAPPLVDVEDVVTVALVVILFDGGLHLGWRRVRRAAGSIAVVGVAGTVLTAAAAAALLHAAFGIAWYDALLVGTAVAPTDPAVVFSVLGRREIVGDAGTVLEAESGANDPVGIALLVSLLAAGHVSAGAAGAVAARFAEQMAVGGAIGVSAGLALLWVVRRIALSSESLYALLLLASIQLVYGVAALAHGSGFLAVFAVGIVLGDAHAPFKAEIVRFHGALASLGEIVAFVVLGLTVDLGQVGRPAVWVPGLVLGAVLALLVRPVVVSLCLAGSPLAARERAFVALVGLKGAVPILLGTMLLSAHLAAGPRLYAVIVVVVVVSVVGQGSAVPAIARLTGIRMRLREPEPWVFGTRLAAEPRSARRFSVAAGSPADGASVAALTSRTPIAWVSFLVRRGALVAARPDVVLEAGDEVLVLLDSDAGDAPAAAFTRVEGPDES